MPKKAQTAKIPDEVRAWRDTLKPLKRFGISLYDQQLWCWGYDIRQKGNLLLRYGFDQYRQDKSCGGTAYTLEPGGGVTLRLWGGNIVYILAGVGALHLKRYEFEPRVMLAQSEVAYTPPDTSSIPQTPDECLRAAALSVPCMRWIAEYERWVIEHAGLEHRALAVQGWKQNAVYLIDPDKMSALWDENATALEGFMNRTAVTTPG